MFENVSVQPFMTVDFYPQINVDFQRRGQVVLNVSLSFIIGIYIEQLKVSCVSLSSDDDDDGNKNGKTTTLHVYHAFLYISLPSLNDYDVKLPNFTFCREGEQKTTSSFFFF